VHVLREWGAFEMTEDEDRFLDKLETLYTAARDLMDGTTSPIRRLIDEGDVVYGVWPDAIKPHGIDYGVLKGGELLEKDSGRVVVLLRETVVPCQSRDQALRIRAVFCSHDLYGNY
jgi:hypothetical protein